MKRPTIVSLEGNIGAGKSSMMQGLQNTLALTEELSKRQVIFVREPVDIWESIRDPVTGDSILKLYYADEKKYAFTFQIMAFITRLSLLRQTVRDHPDADVFIVERSLDADHNVFMQMLYDDRLIEDVERQVYEKWFQEFEQEFGSTGIVYLECSPAKCSERIQYRQRQGEDKIPIEYLEKLGRYHEDWMGRVVSDRTQLLIVNTNPDVDFGDLQFSLWTMQIFDFITSLVQGPSEDDEPKEEETANEKGETSSSVMNSEFGIPAPLDSPPATRSASARPVIPTLRLRSRGSEGGRCMVPHVVGEVQIPQGEIGSFDVVDSSTDGVM